MADRISTGVKVGGATVAALALASVLSLSGGDERFDASVLEGAVYEAEGCTDSMGDVPGADVPLDLAEPCAHGAIAMTECVTRCGVSGCTCCECQAIRVPALEDEGHPSQSTGPPGDPAGG